MILRLFYSFLFLTSCIAGFAQTNSVELLDGSGTLLSQHNSISSAYASIPATVTQAYTIEIKTTYTGASETFPITFVNKVGASATNTITLRPEASATSITVSAAQSGANLVYLNGATFVRIDGRPGGSGTATALTFTNSGTTANTHTIRFENSASNNIVRNCSLNNASTTGTGRNVSMFSGSSDNLIFNNTITGGRYVINISGSTTSNNTIRGCRIIDPVFAALWLQASANGVIIDSNEIYCTTGSFTGAFGAILFDAQSDISIITRNYIHDLNNGTLSGDIMGIHIRSGSTTTTDYVQIANNFIDLSNSEINTSTEVTGIRLSGSNPINTGIYYNTIRIGGTLSTGGTANDVGSACMQNLAGSTSNVLDSKNNILVNDRTGGTTGLRHVCVDVSSTTGTLLADYNVFTSASGDLATVGTTVFNTLATYQTAVSPNEPNTNDQAITFVSSSDLHLNNSMVGNANLTGIAIVGITEDIDGDSRLVPFRGADELLSTPCAGTPDAGIVLQTSDTICLGSSSILSLSGQAFLGYSYQWQSRPVGGTFTSPIADTTSTITVLPTTAFEYRCIVTCVNSGLSDTTNIATLEIFDPVSVASIAFTNTINTFNFSAVNAQNEITYSWDFGDGNVSSNPASSNTYNQSGLYTVTLVVSNQCGSDTVETQIEVGCFGTPNGSISPINTTICAGDVQEIIVGFTNPAMGPYFDLQWEESTDNTTFTPMAGETDDTLAASPIVSTFYRCVISCGASGQSIETNVAELVVQTSNVDSITSTNTNNDYQFDVVGAQNIATYAWDFGDGNTSILPNPQHVYQDTGWFTVTLTSTAFCGEEIVSLKLVYVECTGPAEITQITQTNIGLQYTFEAIGGTANTTYFWSFGDGSSVSGGKTVTHTYASDGFYSVLLIAENDCGDGQFVLTFQIALGVDQIEQMALKVYPNPATDRIVIATNEQLDKIALYNNHGQLVYQSTSVALGKETLNISHLASGVYHLQVVSGEHIVSRQISIQ